MRLAIGGLGLATALGTSAVEACAAARAGLSRASEAELDVPVAAHVLSGVTDGFTGVGRLSRLAMLALDDLLQSSGLAPAALASVALVLHVRDDFHARANDALEAAELELKSGAHFEFHRVRIRNHKGRIEKAPYFIANLLDIVDCMDEERSDYVVDPMDPTQAMTVRRLELDLDKIPENIQIFRLGSNRRLFMVRKALAFEIYRTHKCEGMLFKKIELYGEEFRTTPPDHST